MTTFDTDALVDQLSSWVLVESPTRDVAGVNRMIDLLAADLIDTNVSVERIPGRQGLGDALVARMGPQTDQKGILILSHVDTVHPVGTLQSGLPLRRNADRLYGPGVYDMKGGLCLALAAFKEVAASGAAKLPITFLFTPDEEIGSPASRKIIEHEARHAAYALITEPARDGGRIVTARKGVGNFNVEITGRPSHAGTGHQRGRSAIREAAHQILAIEAMTDYDRGTTTNVGMISGGTNQNVVPRDASFTVDLRVMDANEAEVATRKILGLTPVDPDVSLSVTGGMNRPAYAKTPEVQRLLEKAQTLAAEIGFELNDVPIVGGGSDGNFTAALNVPTLDGLGIDGDGAHTLEEYGLISSLVPRARLMQRLLETLG